MQDATEDKTRGTAGNNNSLHGLQNSRTPLATFTVGSILKNTEVNMPLARSQKRKEYRIIPASSDWWYEYSLIYQSGQLFVKTYLLATQWPLKELPRGCARQRFDVGRICSWSCEGGVDDDKIVIKRRSASAFVWLDDFTSTQKRLALIVCNHQRLEYNHSFEGIMKEKITSEVDKRRYSVKDVKGVLTGSRNSER